MSTTHTMPGQVAIAINDLLDTCAEIKADQRVLIVASPDGLTGGINLVDEAVVAWIEAALRQRGAHPTVLWTDIPGRVHEWRLPPPFRAAVAGFDVVISHALICPSRSFTNCGT